MSEVRRNEEAAVVAAEKSGSVEGSESDSDEEDSSDDTEESASDSDESDSESDEEEEDGPSMYAQFVTKWSPTLAWLHAKTGSIGWIIASTFLVVVMPLAFETEREVMQMEQMAEQRKLAAQGQLPVAGGPGAGVLPKV